MVVQNGFWIQKVNLQSNRNKSLSLNKTDLNPFQTLSKSEKKQEGSVALFAASFNLKKFFGPFVIQNNIGDICMCLFQNFRKSWKTDLLELSYSLSLFYFSLGGRCLAQFYNWNQCDVQATRSRDVSSDGLLWYYGYNLKYIFLF